MYGYVIHFLECELPSFSPNVPDLTFCVYFKLTLPETDSSPLKIDHPKRKLVCQQCIFRCYVSFREGTSLPQELPHLFLKKTPPPAEGPPYLPAPLRKWWTKWSLQHRPGSVQVRHQQIRWKCRTFSNWQMLQDPSAPRPFWKCILGRYWGSKYLLKRRTSEVLFYQCDNFSPTSKCFWSCLGEHRDPY